MGNEFIKEECVECSLASGHLFYAIEQFLNQYLRLPFAKAVCFLLQNHLLGLYYPKCLKELRFVSPQQPLLKSPFALVVVQLEPGVLFEEVKDLSSFAIAQSEVYMLLVYSVQMALLFRYYIEVPDLLAKLFSVLLHLPLQTAETPDLEGQPSIVSVLLTINLA